MPMMIYVNGVITEGYVEKIIGKKLIKIKTHTSNFFLAIILLLYGCGDSNVQLSQLDNSSTILAFGDSLTFGTGAPKGQDYPSKLSELIKVTVINEGVPGEISSQGLKRLPSLLDEVQPNLVILIHGGNDILRKLSKIDLKNNLSAMISYIQERDIEVIMLGVPEPGLLLKSAKLYEDIEIESKIPVNTKLLVDILGDRNLKSDLAHPNSKGYQALAEGIYKFLKKNGAIQDN